MAWNNVSEKKVEVKRTAKNKIVEMHPSAQAPSSDTTGRDQSPKENSKDLNSGMELLELDFLLSIIENTEGNDRNDVTMRKLNFNEVLRRSKQSQIDSNALSVYAVNDGDLYGKDIQCEATKELVRRTTK